MWGVVFTNMAESSSVPQRALAVKVITILDAFSTILTWIWGTYRNFGEKTVNRESWLSGTVETCVKEVFCFVWTKIQYSQCVQRGGWKGSLHLHSQNGGIEVSTHSPRPHLPFLQTFGPEITQQHELICTDYILHIYDQSSWENVIFFPNLSRISFPCKVWDNRI